MFIVCIRTKLKLRIRALLAQHRLVVPEMTDLFGRKGSQWLTTVTLPEPDQSLLQENLTIFNELGARLKATEKLIAQLANGDQAVGWLASLPGIGQFFSVLIRYEVDDIARFREARKFAAYTGLVPSTYASGERQVHGRLTKPGNKWLRWAFIEAVTPAIVHSPWLRRFSDRIKRRRGPKDARAATARKLAELTWRIWTEKRRYVEP